MKEKALSSCPIIDLFFDNATNTATYLIHSGADSKAAIIDPVLGYSASSGTTDTIMADKIIEKATALNLTVDYILETHAHADHITGAPYLKEKLGGNIGIGENIVETQSIFKNVFNLKNEFKCNGEQFDLLVADQQVLKLGPLDIKVMHTPGHTPACVCYYVGDAIFVGDTMFMPDSGTARCDFPGGDATTLYNSIARLKELPEATRVFVGHDYGQGGREIAVETTIKDQRLNNIHISDDKSKDDYIKMRTTRDATLSPPALILPAIQVNIRAGYMPEAEDNDVHYLKIPINLLGS